MYIISKKLKDDIESIKVRTEKEFAGAVRFAEYIAIPCFGSNIILRFNYIGKHDIDINELNSLETRLSQCAGSRYLTGFMSSVYGRFGLNSLQISNISQKINALSDQPVEYSDCHEDGLDRDVKKIREIFELSDDVKIWEIQVDPDFILVLAIDYSHAATDYFVKIKNYEGMPIRLLILKKDDAFNGLMKAEMIARRQGVSICQVLLDYKDK